MNLYIQKLFQLFSEDGLMKMNFEGHACNLKLKVTNQFLIIFFTELLKLTKNLFKVSHVTSVLAK